MAQRRMISIKIIDSAKFIKMPVSTQALYFHLLARADDDGVVEAFNVMRMTLSSEDDLKVLAAKEFVKVLNDDLVAYITDWNEHNLIRADRKIHSIYQSLLLQVVDDVEIKEKKERADRKEIKSLENGTSHGQPTDSIGKVRLGKVMLGDVSICEDNTSVDDHQLELDEPKKDKPKGSAKKQPLIENPTSRLDFALQDFIDHRKSIKKPVTERSLQLIKNELNKLSNVESVQIDILNQSIMNGWQGVFALKENNSFVGKKHQTIGEKVKDALSDEEFVKFLNS